MLARSQWLENLSVSVTVSAQMLVLMEELLMTSIP